jgi:hypothetical protein
MNQQQYCVALINELLELEVQARSIDANQIVWERGYLTGFLATLANEDSLVRHQLEARVEKLKHKKHR